MNRMQVFEQNGFEFVVNDSLPPGRRVALTTIPHSKNTVFGVEGTVAPLGFPQYMIRMPRIAELSPAH